MLNKYYVNKKTGEIEKDIWDKNKRNYYSPYEFNFVKQYKKNPQWFRNLKKKYF